MKADWKEVNLGDVVQFNPKEGLSKGTMAKKIAMEHVNPFTRAISKYQLDKYSGGSKFRNGDTIMARITPCLENGKTAQVAILDSGEVGFGSTEFIVLRAIHGITDKDFLYYFAINPELRDIAIKSMVGSSGRQRVQQSVLERYSFPLPSLDEQRSIAATLSCMDNKIELNSKINHNLRDRNIRYVDFAAHKLGEQRVA